MNKQNSNINIKLIIFFIYSAGACIGSFQSVYFHNRHLTYMEIGIAFSIGTIVSLIFQPFWGIITDKFLKKKSTLIIVITSSIILVLLYIKAKSFSNILALIITSSCFMCAIFPLMDAYILDAVDEYKDSSYSSYRLMASAGFAITNLFISYMIKYYGINISFIFYDIFSIIALIFLLNTNVSNKVRKNSIHLNEVNAILLNKNTIIYFITIFLMNASIMAGSNYMNDLIIFNKGEVSTLGMVWFITATVEVFILYFYNKLFSHKSIIKIYSISIAIYAIKFILDFAAKSPSWIIAIQMIEGIAFPLFVTSSIEILNKKMPSHYRTTIISISATIAGLGVLSANFLSGMALTVINPSQLYGVLSIICLIAFVISKML